MDTLNGEFWSGEKPKKFPKIKHNPKAPLFSKEYIDKFRRFFKKL